MHDGPCREPSNSRPTLSPRCVKPSIGYLDLPFHLTPSPTPPLINISHHAGTISEELGGKAVIATLHISGRRPPGHPKHAEEHSEPTCHDLIYPEQLSSKPTEGSHSDQRYWKSAMGESQHRRESSESDAANIQLWPGLPWSGVDWWCGHGPLA